MLPFLTQKNAIIWVNSAYWIISTDKATKGDSDESASPVGN